MLSSHIDYRAYSIAIDPTSSHASYWVTGRLGTEFVVVKYDLPLSGNTETIQPVTSLGGRGSSGMKILTQVDPLDIGGYSVYACGYLSGNGSTLPSPVTYDGQIVTGTNSTPLASATIKVFDKDIALVKLSSTTTQAYTQTFDKNSLPNIYYSETGPLSARLGDPNNQVSNSNLTLTYLEETQN